VNSTDRCPSCGRDAARVRGPRKITVGRRHVTVEDDFVRCDFCKSDFYHPGQLTDLQIQVANEIRKKEGLLTPGEIKAIRRRLRLTQPKLESLLGVGPKSVTRWEKGTVFQSGATDRLLRAIDQVPGVAGFLGDLAGMEVRDLSNVSELQFVVTGERGESWQHHPRSYWPNTATQVIVGRTKPMQPFVTCGDQGVGQ
jgi:HTH-type transcriptional regulator/antitoxin MqsA